MPSIQSAMGAALLSVSTAIPVEPLQSRQMSTTTCAEVHIFLAKGNNEPYPGRQSKLVAAICDGLSSCDYEDIVMQNMLEDEYCGAVYEGATNGYDQLNDYNARCPDAKLVISGYSQGAHVIGDILGGGGGTFYNGCTGNETPQLSASSDAGKMVKAILSFGSVRHTADQPYNYESGTGDDSSFPRDSAHLALLDTYQDVWRDYCVSDDPICAQGNYVSAHLTYFDNFTTEAAEWVREKVSATTCDDDCSSSTTGTTSSTASRTGGVSSTVSESRSTVTGSGSTTSELPEATASTTENLSSTPTVSASASASASASSAGSGGSSPNSDSMSLFGLAVAAGFAFLLL